MGKDPIVSVIVPFLNGEQFIHEAIDSVFMQTYDSWELLLVDDGSTDHSTEIAKEYANKYPDKVHYLMHEKHQNKGLSASRNLGVAHSHGEFIAFLDVDDIWFPNKLEKQVNIMKEDPDIGVVVNPAFYWYEDGNKILQPMTLSVGKNQPTAWIIKILEGEDNTACPSAVLIRTDILRRVGGSEELFRGLFEDAVLWIKINLYASYYYDPECLLLYRIHSQSLWNGASENQRQLARMRFYVWLGDCLNRYDSTQFKSCLLYTSPSPRD